MSKMKPAPEGVPVSDLIDQAIADLGDWRGEILARLRALIHAADPDVVEEWKWGKPVWSHDGLICTGETYKAYVKTTFAKGAAVEDPRGLFNSSLEGNVRRAIDFRQGEPIDDEGFKALIRAAVAMNVTDTAARAAKKKTKAPRHLGGTKANLEASTHRGARAASPDR